MEILIYSSELLRKGVIENHTSLIWTRKYFEPGSFELHVPLTQNNVELLKIENIICIRNNIEAGVIEYLELNEIGNNATIIVKGRFMSSYLDRRLIKETTNFNGTIENTMRKIVNDVSKIPRLTLGIFNNYPQELKVQVTMKNALKTLVKLSKHSNIAFRIRPNYMDKTLFFETYCGVDRSLNQSQNNRVVFSEQFNNLNNSVYKVSCLKEKTMVIVGGSGEGENRKYVTVQPINETGLNLKEVFVDAKDISQDGISNEEYENLLKQRGLEHLNKSIKFEVFDFESTNFLNYKYKIDFDLGDIVTFNKQRWNLSIDRRITEIQEIYERGGCTISLKLGDPFPEKIDWSD